MPFLAERAWPIPNRNDCYFYHSIDYPDGDVVTGAWDIRGRFEQYIGGQNLRGKTVLDVGTATGFLAFSAEAAGAQVTALDASDVQDFCIIPFQNDDQGRNHIKGNARFRRLKNAFWYSWHKFGSKAEVIYTPLSELRHWQRRFDVVIAGALIEHLSDPVTVIGDLSRLAKDVLILGFTDIVDTDDLLMRTVNDWSRPQFNYSWWVLSRGLYKRIFDNLGFVLEIRPCSAIFNPDPANDLKQPLEVYRSTILARRRYSASALKLSL